MRALSLKQPWAWLVVNGIKDIENRNWSNKLRGRIYIHASLKIDKYNPVIRNTESWILERLTREQKKRYYREPKERGAIIGEVDIVGCVTKSTSPWFIGKYGYILTNPVAYNKPIKCKGALKFFTPDLTLKQMKGSFLHRE
jgi:hypothetical protein